MDLGDHPGEQDAADRVTRGRPDLQVAEHGAVEPDESAREVLGVAQVDQTSNDWAESRGAMGSSPLNSAPAARTASSCLSSSLIRRLTLASSSGS